MHGRLSQDFRARATYGVCLTGLVFMSPLAINNVVHGRYAVSAGAFAILAFFLCKIALLLRGRDHQLLTLLGVCPCILLFLHVALRDQGVIGVLWTFPAIISVYFMLPERWAWTINLLILGLVIPQAHRVVPPDVALRVAVTLCVVSIFTVIFVRALETQQQHLIRQATLDPLTGVANRTRLEDTLTAALQSASADSPASLLVLDVDHFKKVNDTYGHAAGDEALRRIAALLRETFGEQEPLFRLGGEEFAALLPRTGKRQALADAETLRRSIEVADMPHSHRLTVSIGVATCRPGEDWQTWMQRADAHLYQAKRTGRNSVSPAPPYPRHDASGSVPTARASDVA